MMEETFEPYIVKSRQVKPRRSMANSYNDLWKMLIDKEMDKGALCSKAKISKGSPRLKVGMRR